MIFRALAIAGLVVVIASSAGNGKVYATQCEVRPIGESELSYVKALGHRLRALGVSEIDPIGPSVVSDRFLALGADFSIFIKQNSGFITEIGFVLSEPAEIVETEKLMTSVAFTASRFTGFSESSIKEKNYLDAAQHKSGSWIGQYGVFTLAFSRTEDGLVVKMGNLVCE